MAIAFHYIIHQPTVQLVLDVWVWCLSLGMHRLHQIHRAHRSSSRSLLFHQRLMQCTLQKSVCSVGGNVAFCTENRGESIAWIFRCRPTSGQLASLSHRYHEIWRLTETDNAARENPRSHLSWAASFNHSFHKESVSWYHFSLSSAEWMADTSDMCARIFYHLCAYLLADVHDHQILMY